MLYSSEKNLHFAKQVLLPNSLLQLPTVHYGSYSQDSLRCELYTVSTTWLFFAISHLPVIMKMTIIKKICILLNKFATQHSFASNSVQSRYEGLQLMMVTFHYDGLMRNCEKTMLLTQCTVHI